MIRFSQSAFLNANPLFNIRDNGIPHLINEQNKPPLNRFQSRLAGWLVGRTRSLWYGLAVVRKWSFVSDGPVNTGQHDLSRENVCADFIPRNFLIWRGFTSNALPRWFRVMRSFAASDIDESFSTGTFTVNHLINPCPHPCWVSVIGPRGHN